LCVCLCVRSEPVNNQIVGRQMRTVWRACFQEKSLHYPINISRKGAWPGSRVGGHRPMHSYDRLLVWKCDPKIVRERCGLLYASLSIGVLLLVDYKKDGRADSWVQADDRSDTYCVTYAGVIARPGQIKIYLSKLWPRCHLHTLYILSWAELNSDDTFMYVVDQMNWRRK